jgi:hypothetical protein
MWNNNATARHRPIIGNNVHAPPKHQ